MLSGRCVVVTGASGNLGTVVCRRLARDGARVFSIDRSVADVTDEEQVERAYDVAHAQGPVWASVHCAGAWAGGDVAHTDLALFEKMLAINLRSAFLCCRAALRRIKEGRLVNVAAFGPAMLSGIGGNAAYAVSKAGVVALTKSIAEEKHGVRANCVAPGTLRTRANAKAMPRADQAGWVPLEDVAEAIAWLVSPEAGTANGAVVTFPSR